MYLSSMRWKGLSTTVEHDSYDTLTHKPFNSKVIAYKWNFHPIEVEFVSRHIGYRYFKWVKITYICLILNQTVANIDV